MGFNKGHKKFGGRVLGTSNKLTKYVRECISKAIDIDRVNDALNQITDPLDYINEVSKLLPYFIGKVKPTEDIESEHRDIVINLVPYDEG